MQYTAARCNTLQHTATHFNTLHHTDRCRTHRNRRADNQRMHTQVYLWCISCDMQATHSYTKFLLRLRYVQDNQRMHTQVNLWCVSYGMQATHCNTLQHTATHCTTQIDVAHTEIDGQTTNAFTRKYIYDVYHMNMVCKQHIHIQNSFNSHGMYMYLYV